MTIKRYRVQVVTVGTHEPIYKWMVVRAETPGIAAANARMANLGMGGLGSVEVIAVEEGGTK
jgi:hypothetical protein